jgi:hypothetical protein
MSTVLIVALVPMLGERADWVSGSTPVIIGPVDVVPADPLLIVDPG